MDKQGKNAINTVPSETLYLNHLLIIIAGFFLGLLAAYFFMQIPFDFSSELQEAKDLGIVSPSILKGYPKSKDNVLYLSLLLFPFLFSVAAWYFWARKKMAGLRDIFQCGGQRSVVRGRAYPFVAVMLIAEFILIFHMTDFYIPNWNQAVGSWPFLGEEGENLAWVQSILSGGVYGKDFFCIYGPLLIYPVAWAMKLFGATVVIERAMKYCYDLLAFGLIVFFMFRTLRLKYLPFLAGLIYIALFPPYRPLSVNFTTLRFVLGLMPFLLIHFYRDSGRRSLLFLAGVVTGLSVLFSQEAGIASLMVCVCVFFMDDVLVQRRVGGFFADTIILLSGLAVAVAPMLIFFAVKGAIAPFFESIYGFPKFRTLGYGSFPFPPFKEFILNPLMVFPLAYWMIFFYCVMCIYIAVLFILKNDDRLLFLKTALLLYSIVLFNVPLSRVSTENAMKVFQPTFLLLVLQIDTAAFVLLNNKKLRVRIGHAVFTLLLIGTLSVVFFHNPVFKWQMKGILERLEGFPRKLTVNPIGVDLKEIERGKVFYHSDTANSIVKIRQFLDTYAKEERYVYFFPNEAAYYFIFNKQNPTRYAFAYFAITSLQRQDLIADLEKNKPRFIVYSLQTWRIDNIPETIQTPEVVYYMSQKYKLRDNFGDVVILERIP